MAPSRPHVKGRTSGKAFIVSNNIHRRNLNSGQRAMAMAMMYPEPAETSKNAMNDKTGSVDQNLSRAASRWPVPSCARTLRCNGS